MIAGIYVKRLLLSIFLYVKEVLRAGHKILWAGVERVGKQKLWDDKLFNYDLIIT